MCERVPPALMYLVLCCGLSHDGFVLSRDGTSIARSYVSLYFRIRPLYCRHSTSELITYYFQDLCATKIVGSCM